MVAFSFIVQDPSGIMLVLSERSRPSKRCKYRSISVSERYRWKTGCSSIGDVRVRSRGMAEGASSRYPFGAEFHAPSPRAAMAEHGEEIVDVLRPGRLVERDADRPVLVVPKVDFHIQRPPQNVFPRHLGRHHLDRIEEAIVDEGMTELTETMRQGRG